MMKKILLWLRIIRPQTLFASLIPVCVAIRVVYTSASESPIVARHPVWLAVVTAVCALGLQVLANLINDYYDFIRGADKAGRVGFRRPLAEGEVSRSQMKKACLLTLTLVLCTGVWLVLVGGWFILLIGLSALLFAWLYTATSHSLSYLGIADVFVFLYYGVLASVGTAYLFTRVFSVQAFHAGAVCGLISMCVLMTNNLRDEEDDRTVGKRTFVVRFGRPAAFGLLMSEVLLMPFFAYKAFGLSWPMTIGIVGLVLWCAVFRAKGTQYNRCLLAAGLTNVLYALLCLCV